MAARRNSLPHRAHSLDGRSLQKQLHTFWKKLGVGTGPGYGRRHSVDPGGGGGVRRASVGLVRSLDVGGLHSSIDTALCDRIEFEDFDDEEDDLIYAKFFEYYRCYDLIPISAKLVVFDTQLLVKKAFFALVQNGVRAAPLWDNSVQNFVGMLTVTDFINILRNYYDSSSVRMEELEEQKIETWRNVLKKNVQPLVSIEPDASLFEALKTLIHSKVHRLPIIDSLTGNVLYILTHRRILKFLFLYYKKLPRPSFLDELLEDVHLGTYHNIATAFLETPLIEALTLFINRRISSLPVVDDQGKVIDIYAKFDVINLASKKNYSDLNISIQQAMEHRDQWIEGVLTCGMKDSLGSILERVVKAEVHRLVVVDSEDRVTGIISLSDILNFLVLKPLAEGRKTKRQMSCEEEFLQLPSSREDSG